MDARLDRRGDGGQSREELDRREELRRCRGEQGKRTTVPKLERDPVGQASHIEDDVGRSSPTWRAPR